LQENNDTNSKAFWRTNLQHNQILKHSNLDMGIHMEDIHNPSVPSSSNSTSLPSASSTNGTPSREEVLQLMERKDLIEAELNALGAVLDSVSFSSVKQSSSYSPV